jgi:hypothetical protein
VDAREPKRTHPIFVYEDPEAIRLRGETLSVACIYRVLRPYGNWYTA